MHYKKSSINLNLNQTRYGQVRVVSYTIDQWVHAFMAMVLKCTQNTIKEKFVVTERFVRALKSKIYKHMTAVSKSVYIDARNETVDKYNKTYYGTIKMNSGDVKLDNDIDYGVGHSDEDPKFKIGEYQIGLKK